MEKQNVGDAWNDEEFDQIFEMFEEDGPVGDTPDEENKS